MKNEIKKFLEFNGKSILFKKIDGHFYVAIKPVCEALEIDYVRQFKNLKNNEFLGQLLSDQTMVGEDLRERKMICLPEFYFYGWLFEANAKSDAYKLYKWKCYEILYDYFNGIMTHRSLILEEKVSHADEVAEAKKRLEENEDYLLIKGSRAVQTKYTTELKALDQKLINQQPDLFTKQ